MIKILVVGDSYTEGDELWEELNVPNYSSMTIDDARQHSVYNSVTDGIRRGLTYTGIIQKLRPEWEVFNFGKGGASQLIIVDNAFNQYLQIKERFPDDKIICIMQDTFRTRLTFYSSKKMRREGMNVDNINNQLRNHPESKELIGYVKTFLDDEYSATQFYYQLFNLRNFFKLSSVPFINFSFINHEYTYRYDTNSNISKMKKEYLKHSTLYPMGGLQRVYDYHQVKENDTRLPGLHLKGKYHELIASDLVNYIENNFI